MESFNDKSHFYEITKSEFKITFILKPVNKVSCSTLRHSTTPALHWCSLKMTNFEPHEIDPVLLAGSSDDKSVKLHNDDVMLCNKRYVILNHQRIIK